MAESTTSLPIKEYLRLLQKIEELEKVIKEKDEIIAKMKKEAEDKHKAWLDTEPMKGMQ